MYNSPLDDNFAAFEHGDAPPEIRNHSFHWYLVRFIRALAIIDALFIIGIAILSAILSFGVRKFAADFSILFHIFFYILPVGILLPYTIILYIKLFFKTLLYSSNGVVHEKYRVRPSPAPTDTPAKAQSTVISQWWDCILHMYRDYAFLGVILAGTIIYTYILTSDNHLIRSGQYINFTSPAMPFLSVVITLIFTLINLPLTASFGVLSGLINARFGFIASIILRGATPFVLYATIYDLTISIYAIDFAHIATFSDTDGILPYVLLNTGSNIFTEGFLIAFATLSERGYQAFLSLHALYVIILSLGIYSALTLLNLEHAKWLAKRQGLL